MSAFKPLVLDPNNETPLKQLQGTDDLDIPLSDRVSHLESQMSGLINFLSIMGIEVPEEIESIN
jgi:hypothetical protein